MAMNPISITYAVSASGAQVALAVDWRAAPNGLAYEVLFNSGASGSVTVDTTLDDVNDILNNPVPHWSSSAAITSNTRGTIGAPVQYVRLTIGSLAGGTLTFKVLEGAPDAGGGSSGGGAASDVNLIEVGGAAISEGQKAMAASLPVVIASDQSIIPVNTPVTKRVTQSPTVSASPAYSTGDVIGTLMTFTGVMRANDITGILQQVYINCKSAQTGAVDFIAFNANPAATTFTDNAALAINAADFDKVAGVAHITDWTNLGTPSFAQAIGLAIPMTPAAGTTTIYGVLVARSTPTLGSTSDITVGVKMLDD